MITKSQYKLLAAQISKLFCNDEPICMAGVKERLLNFFNDGSFAFFLQHIEVGRFYVLQYSNWRATSHCRTMKIDVKLTDVITGQVTTGFWQYDNSDCGDKQYYYPDLNTLISRSGYQLLDQPITTKTTADIIKPRMVYNPNKAGYGISFKPTVPGGSGGTITPTPTPTPTPLIVPDQSVVNKPASFLPEGLDLKMILIVGGIGLAAWYLMKK